MWREAAALDDSALDELIRSDEIDILVDLTMHMANGRPLLFARRAAPIQVAYLAYPGTTGIPGIDYRLTDPRLDPPGYDAHYTEKSVRLADSYWCYDPLTDEPAVNALPALARGFVTLGCLNNPCKITDLTLRLWAGILHALPDSQLLLMAPPGSGREHLLARLQVVGVAADRVRFVPFQPRLDYLRTHHEIDLGLDTFPYGGHTTSLDSYWMGVPVVTRIGSTCVGRAGLSQLHSLDLLELAAETDADFVRTVVALATDLPRLAALRQELRPRLERSVLMDHAAFARNIEAAYRQMAAEQSSSAARHGCENREGEAGADVHQHHLAAGISDRLERFRQVEPLRRDATAPETRSRSRSPPSSAVAARLATRCGCWPRRPGRCRPDRAA